MSRTSRPWPTRRDPALALWRDALSQLASAGFGGPATRARPDDQPPSPTRNPAGEALALAGGATGRGADCFRAALPARNSRRTGSSQMA